MSVVQAAGDRLIRYPGIAELRAHTSNHKLNEEEGVTARLTPGGLGLSIWRPELLLLLLLWLLLSL